MIPNGYLYFNKETHFATEQLITVAIWQIHKEEIRKPKVESNN